MLCFKFSARCKNCFDTLCEVSSKKGEKVTFEPSNTTANLSGSFRAMTFSTFSVSKCLCFSKVVTITFCEKEYFLVSSFSKNAEGFKSKHTHSIQPLTLSDFLQCIKTQSTNIQLWSIVLMLCFRMNS